MERNYFKLSRARPGVARCGKAGLGEVWPGGVRSGVARPGRVRLGWARHGKEAYGWQS